MCLASRIIHVASEAVKHIVGMSVRVSRRCQWTRRRDGRDPEGRSPESIKLSDLEDTFLFVQGEFGATRSGLQVEEAESRTFFYVWSVAYGKEQTIF